MSGVNRVMGDLGNARVSENICIKIGKLNRFGGRLTSGSCIKQGI